MLGGVGRDHGGKREPMVEIYTDVVYSELWQCDIMRSQTGGNALLEMRVKARASGDAIDLHIHTVYNQGLYT